ncbi:hypothetical protein BDM02DRAFT_1246975 [Thelephora ganbajun]|uniref:Uncharacterized protein n=1 Tax=Thelephora ganbajun TaxID=370292 RepID=A0ACB6Z367_THEGA|nr:hypothetical protein BDM02DRAFT_1246975 [Thelephora ganbajun]
MNAPSRSKLGFRSCESKMSSERNSVQPPCSGDYEQAQLRGTGAYLGSARIHQGPPNPPTWEVSLEVVHQTMEPTRTAMMDDEIPPLPPHWIPNGEPGSLTQRRVSVRCGREFKHRELRFGKKEEIR